MKIAVYGATGNIGSVITAEALSRGHQVTALSRSGASVGGAFGAQAALDDTATFAQIASKHDAVVISVKPAGPGESPEPVIQAHRDLIAAAPSARIFVVGGAGSLLVDGVQLQELPDFPAVYKAGAQVMTTILDLYRNSTGLNWTVLSPAPEIGPGERTGAYNVGLDSPVGSRISRDDYAVAVLDELESPKHVGQRFTVAN